MTIKLVAIDLDGTLLNENHEITQPVIDTIKAARKNGVYVVLCTGRPLTGARAQLDLLELN